MVSMFAAACGSFGSARLYSGKLVVKRKHHEFEMHKAVLDGVELEYELHGDGEPVVLIHPGIFADWFTPLLQEAALTSRYRLVHYHRVGCAGSSRVARPVNLAEQAAHARLLMQHLRIARAHVVGHSSSGNIALQLALDAPDAVRSPAVLEPALMSVPSATTSRVFVGAAVQRYRGGDKAGAVDSFLRGTCGPASRGVLDQALPGAFDQHVADADTFFRTGAARAAAVVVPAGGRQARHSTSAGCCGARSLELDPIWGERQQLLLDWVPNVEPFVLPDATHLLQVENSRAMAECLAAFFARHSLTVPA